MRRGTLTRSARCAGCPARGWTDIPPTLPCPPGPGDSTGASAVTWLVQRSIMTWIAPAPPPFGGSLVADERTLLEGFLDWQPAGLVGKCTGLTGEELAQRS